MSNKNLADLTDLPRYIYKYLANNRSENCFFVFKKKKTERKTDFKSGID